MKKLFPLALMASLSACVTTPQRCAGAETRRAVYTTAIDVADAAIAAGHGTPAVLLGREAAVTALTILDRTCPSPAR